MPVTERLFARWYPVVAGWSENAGQDATRAELFSTARGATLEVGAGSGYNLPHYTERVSQLVVTDPSPHMQQHLQGRLEDQPPPVGSWQLVEAGAEDLPFADRSFDTVTGAFVHCTIPDPATALREIARVLKPGGRYLFLEHVRSPDNPVLGTVQDLVERPHAWIAAGCHPNRRFAELLEQSPLHVADRRWGRMPRSSPTVRPTIRGVAVRPG